MKPEKKSVVVLADTNPIDVTLSRDVRTVNKISLVYFKMQGFDTAQPPYSLWMKIEGVSNPSVSVVNSYIQNQTAGTYKIKSNDTFPLYFKMGDPYINNLGNAQQYQVLHGIQPKGMRWHAENVSNISNFKVTLMDDNNVPLPLTIGGKIMLVFDAEWLPSQLQSTLWKTDRTYMNSMNS